jgi:trehalose-6-phosphate synthase
MARGIDSQGSVGHFVRVDVFPGGIDFETFEHITSQATVKARVDQLRNLFKDKLVIVSRDRVDEIEGVPLKLHVIEKFFQKYPEWKGKVVYFQVLIPFYLLEFVPTQNIRFSSHKNSTTLKTVKLWKWR